MRALAFILISALATGCAATSEGSGPGSTTARSAAAPPAAPAAVAPPAAPETAAPAESVAGAGKSTAPSSGKDGKDEFIPPSGYRAVKKGNETVYCATIKPIGSNLTKTACFTQEQLEEIDRRAQGMRQDVQQKQRAGCASGVIGCGGG